MGNSASKKALIAAAEQRSVAAQTSLAARERDLAELEKSLQATKSDHENVSSEAAKLRKLIKDLDLQYAAVDDERKREIERLSSQVKQKGNETLAQQQVSRLRTNERDEAREKARKFEERVGAFEKEKGEIVRSLESKINELERETMGLLSEAEGRRTEAEQERDAQAAELENTRNDVLALSEKLAALQENNRMLAEQLASAKTSAAREVSKARADAVENLSIARSAAAAKQASRNSAAKALAVRIWRIAKAEAPAAPLVMPEVSRASSKLESENGDALEPATPTPALTMASSWVSTPSDDERPSPASSIKSGKSKDFSKPIPFSLYPRIGKDLRVEVGQNEEEVMVEIREWHRGVRSFKGISIPVGDAGELVKILPDVVRMAELREEKILKEELQRESMMQDHMVKDVEKMAEIAVGA